MKAATLEKVLATKKAKSEQFESQTIPVDGNWQIARADELNWEIQCLRDGAWRFGGYFGRLVDAFKALPHKMLAAEAKGSIGECIELQKAINAKVERALELAAKEHRLLS